MCRIRSRHARRTCKKSSKRSPLIQLREALCDDSVYPNGRVTEADLCELRAKARELESLFAHFEYNADTGATGSEGLEVLLEIVQTAESFASHSLNRIISALRSSRMLDPSTKEYLPIAIQKLARYSLSSRYLVATARNRGYSVFKDIRVESVSIPRPIESLFQGPFSTLEQAGQNVINANIPAQKQKNILPIRSLLGPTYDDKAKEFQVRVCSESDVWKVHAEIQLVVYHELNPERTKPRVIASSKSACYLCNALIHLHGQFHVPRTHGRIYDRWVFPDWVNFAEKERNQMSMAVEQLNCSLENTVIDTLRSGRARHNHPNESVLFPVKQLSSSTLSVVQLATPLPTPPGSQTSSHTQFMQMNSAQTSASRIPIPPMDTVPEDQIPNIPTPVPASGAEETSLDDDADRGSSVLKRTMSRDYDIENESDRIIEDVEGEASIREQRTVTLSSSPPSIPEYRSRHGLGQSSSHKSVPRIPTEANLASTPIISTSTDIRNHILAHPCQAVSDRLTSPTSEIYIKAGKLHLTLSREFPPLPHLHSQFDPDCTVNVKWLTQKEQNDFKNSNESREIINARDMAEGEAITIDRGGWLSENNLILSCGSETCLSIRYGFGGVQR